MFICDGCVALCADAIRGKPGAAPQLTPWELANSKDEALVALPLIAAAGVQVEANLARWVRRARSLGATWAAVGEALGMTRQSAWERFSKEE